MYKHCLTCRAELGSNESIEIFPIGTRLAFHSAKGRLWVVCRACGAWNLTPLEERWEAMESCERLFHDARRKVQGEEIGLAREPGGLELVRIGRPQRRELAAWRYGTLISRQRHRLLLTAGAGVAAGGLVLAGLPLLGASAATVFSLLSIVSNATTIAHARRLSDLKFDDPEGKGQIVVTINEKGGARLVSRPESEGGWGIDLPYARRLHGDEHWLARYVNTPGGMGIARFSGNAAVPVLARVLPMGYAGRFRPALVDDAVQMVEQAGGPDRWFAEAATRTRLWGADQTWGDTGAILHLPKPARLALLIAAHESDERRAMEGALAELEERWKEAEEIAAIADDLFLPAGVTKLLARLKASGRG